MSDQEWSQSGAGGPEPRLPAGERRRRRLTTFRVGQAWVDRPSYGDRFEQLLQQLVIMGLVALVVVQVLLAHPTMRRLLVLAERMEGLDWYGGPPAAGPLLPGVPSTGAPAARLPSAGGAAAEGAASRASAGGDEAHSVVQAVSAPVPKGRIKLILTDQPAAPQVWLLAGGQPVGDFRQGERTVTVSPGTPLQLDARHATRALRFRVVEVRGLTIPDLGFEVTALPGEIRDLVVPQ